MYSWTKELDEAAILATRSGSWHILLFYLLCALAAIPTSFLVFSQVFTNATPVHWCAPPTELQLLNLPDDLVRSLTIPRSEEGYETCKGYAVDPTQLYDVLEEYVKERSELIHEAGSLRLVKIKQLVAAEEGKAREEQIARIKQVIPEIRSAEARACTNGWQFDKEHYEQTLVTEFSLVCENDWLPRTSSTLFWVGSIFGNLVFGWISDRYGRRPTILLMIFLEVPLAIATSFPGSYWSYTALRIAGGLFFPALYQQPFILALELMPPERRTYAGIVVGMLFAIGMCLLAALAYALRDWFQLSLATSLPFVLLYGYYWLIPESPRWLVGRGRIADAEKVFRDLAKKNNIQLSRGFLIDIHVNNGANILKRIKKEGCDAEEAMLPAVNGYIYPEITNGKFIDRRISNMLTFKPGFRLTDTNERFRTDNFERILALEVAEIVNKKSELRIEPFGNYRIPEEVHLNSETLQKSTQTDSCTKLPQILGTKSRQFIGRIFFKEETEEDVMENKIMDDQNSDGDCKASLLDMFKYPNIRKKFFILTFDWVALGVVYNSFSYNTPNLGIDDFLAFFIGGAVELPSYFFGWYCMERYGRRWTLCVTMCIGGIACVSCVFVSEEWPWVTVSLAMLGRLFTASSFAVFYVVIGELLPTVVRAQAMGAASFVAGLGLLACPYVVYLAVYARSLPLIIMGALSLMGGVTSLYLPETLNMPLPQTLQDGEMFGKDFKVLSCVETVDTC